MVRIYLTILVLAINGVMSAKGVTLLPQPVFINSNVIKSNIMDTKKCTKCGEPKPLTEFFRRNASIDGLGYVCKMCSTNYSSAYRKTQTGLIATMYLNQIHSSKKRHNEMPAHTKNELIDWCLSKELFHKLYNNWEDSGFKKELTPSCDRTDDYKGYSLDRLRLMTWGENKAKGHSDRKNGINNKVNRAVIGVHKKTLKSIDFHSVHEASRKTLATSSNIIQCCNGRVKSAGGYIWEYKL